MEGGRVRPDNDSNDNCEDFSDGSKEKGDMCMQKEFPEKSENNIISARTININEVKPSPVLQQFSDIVVQQKAIETADSEHSNNTQSLLKQNTGVEERIIDDKVNSVESNEVVSNTARPESVQSNSSQKGQTEKTKKNKSNLRKGKWTVSNFISNHSTPRPCKF